jgi:dTDP-4-dehydrorhamnose 3,5-epimerase
MIVTDTALAGAHILEIEPRADTRGFFARIFCTREFSAHGLDPVVLQGNLSFNFRKGTLRGMHFQCPPRAETKIVRCTRGAIVDVIVDLRPESPTYLQHLAVELTADNRRALYVPRRFAHGYQTLEEHTEVTNLTGEFYAPDFEGGLRHDDPRLDIHWPLPASDISDKDRLWPLLDEAEPALCLRMAPPED